MNDADIKDIVKNLINDVETSPQQYRDLLIRDIYQTIDQEQEYTDSDKEKIKNMFAEKIEEGWAPLYPPERSRTPASAINPPAPTPLPPRGKASNIKPPNGGRKSRKVRKQKKNKPRTRRR